MTLEGKAPISTLVVGTISKDEAERHKGVLKGTLKLLSEKGQPQAGAELGPLVDFFTSTILEDCPDRLAHEYRALFPWQGPLVKPKPVEPVTKQPPKENGETYRIHETEWTSVNPFGSDGDGLGQFRTPCRDCGEPHPGHPGAACPYKLVPSCCYCGQKNPEHASTDCKYNPDRLWQEQHHQQQGQKGGQQYGKFGSYPHPDPYSTVLGQGIKNQDHFYIGQFAENTAPRSNVYASLYKDDQLGPVQTGGKGGQRVEHGSGSGGYGSSSGVQIFNTGRVTQAPAQQNPSVVNEEPSIPDYPEVLLAQAKHLGWKKGGKWYSVWTPPEAKGAWLGSWTKICVGYPKAKGEGAPDGETAVSRCKVGNAHVPVRLAF